MGKFKFNKNNVCVNPNRIEREEGLSSFSIKTALGRYERWVFGCNCNLPGTGFGTPCMDKAYLRCGEEFLKSHPESKTAKQFSDVYEFFVANVFFDCQKDYVKANLGGGIFSGKPDYKKLIEDYFKIELPDFD